MDTKEHWWLKDKPFKRVRLSTLNRLGLVFLSFCAQGHETDSAANFIIWLEKHIEDKTIR